jgi:hypothetical protein
MPKANPRYVLEIKSKQDFVDFMSWLEKGGDCLPVSLDCVDVGLSGSVSVNWTYIPDPLAHYSYSRPRVFGRSSIQDFGMTDEEPKVHHLTLAFREGEIHLGIALGFEGLWARHPLPNDQINNSLPISAVFIGHQKHLTMPNRFLHPRPVLSSLKPGQQAFVTASLGLAITADGRLMVNCDARTGRAMVRQEDTMVVVERSLSGGFNVVEPPDIQLLGNADHLVSAGYDLVPAASATINGVIIDLKDPQNATRFKTLRVQGIDPA